MEGATGECCSKTTVSPATRHACETDCISTTPVQRVDALLLEIKPWIKPKLLDVGHQSGFFLWPAWSVYGRLAACISATPANPISSRCAAPAATGTSTIWWGFPLVRIVYAIKHGPCSQQRDSQECHGYSCWRRHGQRYWTWCLKCSLRRQQQLG